MLGAKVKLGTRLPIVPLDPSQAKYRDPESFDDKPSDRPGDASPTNPKTGLGRWGHQPFNVASMCADTTRL